MSVISKKTNIQQIQELLDDSNIRPLLYRYNDS